MEVLVRVQVKNNPQMWEEVTVDVPEARNEREALVGALHHATHPLSLAVGVDPMRVASMMFARVSKLMSGAQAPATDEKE